MTIVRRAMLFLALLLPSALVASPAAAATSTARHYDCSKAGNANKAACKGVSTSVPAATPSKTTTTETTTKTTSRHYDCTKAGNANKAACKSAAAQTSSGKSPGAVKTTTKTTSSTTDCSHWYSKMHADCRTTTASSGPHTTVAPASKPTTTASRANEGDNANPNGATAQCKDGTYSHAAHHSGACSHHGGVAKFLN